MGAFDSRVVVAGQLRLGGDAGVPSSLGRVLVRSAVDPGDGGVVSAAWSSFSLRGPQVPRGMFGGGATSPTGYVVGDYGAVWEWNPSIQAFEERSKGFYGDVADLAVTQGDVFAAVNECAESALPGPRRHGDAPGRLRPVERVGTLPSTSGQVYAVAAKSPTEVLVTTDVGAFRWDGLAWTSVAISNSNGTINDLTYCGDTGGRGRERHRLHGHHFAAACVHLAHLRGADLRALPHADRGLGGGQRVPRRGG